MLRAASIFLLEVPPLEELTDNIASVVEQYRYKMISKKEALDTLITTHKSIIEKYVHENQLIAELICFVK